MPPASWQQNSRDSGNSFIAAWIIQDDHFAKPVSNEQRHQQGVSLSQTLAPARELTDASTQTADTALDAPASLPPPQPAPRQAPYPGATPRPTPTPSGPSRVPAAPRARSATQPRRTRDQVTRDSYQLLWREYLTLTSAEAEEQQRRQQQRRANSFGLSRIASVFGGNAATEPEAAPAATPAPTMSSTTAPAATILQGPLDYTKPKGLGKVLLMLLCPPSDMLDMQRLTKQGAKLFTLLCKLLVMLSFLVIPAWLWLVRHEWAIGHTGDAVVVGVAGVLLFLAADATNKAAASSAAATKAGVFTASERSAYQSSPGYVSAVAAGGAPSAAATKAGVFTASERSAYQSSPGYVSAVAAAAPPGAAAATHRPAAAAALTAHRSVPAYQAVSSDPAVRQVKQRIMKLERLLFGNELTEADIGPDMLQGRVQALCLEVGVPFGGHGRSSSQMSAGELDAQLQAVEKALGI